MRKIIVLSIMMALLVISCDTLIDAVPADQPKTEISPDQAAAQPPAANNNGAPAANNEPAPAPEPTATPEPTPTPPPEPTATPTRYFLEGVSMASASDRALPRHGLLIALFLPIIGLGVPWVILEIFVVRYVQPRGIDLSRVRIKAKDGLFIEAAISLTARRSLNLASTRMTWFRVRQFVEKTLEQELIHEALAFRTLEELEENLKNVVEKFQKLSIVRELERDFGVEVMRFNVETRYPQETMDALNRKAEAAAGGTAYLAYADAAELDPNSRECRELYRVYQETRGQVDAARNLGGGISSLAGVFGRRAVEEVVQDDDASN